MSDQPADSTALPPPASESWLPGRKSPAQDWMSGPKPPGEGWTRRKFLLVLGFVFAFHLALVFLFGTKKQIVPRPVISVPHLELADSANEFIALGDPTLFARPNAHDLVTAFWRRVPPVVQPDFDWLAPSGYLPATKVNLGAAFIDFMQHSRPPDFTLNFKPEPKASEPEAAGNDATPWTTTMRLAGELARRPLLNRNDLVLPALPRNDVIAPSTVQLLVDTAGNVAFAVVLEPNAASAVVLEPNTTHDHAANQLALQLVRNLRFAPAPRLTFGEVTFTWHTVATNAVPLTNTNANP